MPPSSMKREESAQSGPVNPNAALAPRRGPTQVFRGSHHVAAAVVERRGQPAVAAPHMHDQAPTHSRALQQRRCFVSRLRNTRCDCRKAEKSCQSSREKLARPQCRGEDAEYKMGVAGVAAGNGPPYRRELALHPVPWNLHQARKSFRGGSSWMSLENHVYHLELKP